MWLIMSICTTSFVENKTNIEVSKLVARPLEHKVGCELDAYTLSTHHLVYLTFDAKHILKGMILEAMVGPRT